MKPYRRISQKTVNGVKLKKQYNVTHMIHAYKIAIIRNGPTRGVPICSSNKARLARISVYKQIRLTKARRVRVSGDSSSVM